VNENLNLTEMSDELLDAAVDACSDQVESPTAVDPLTVLAAARLLISLYRELRRRGK
jgi:hypothetical protein